MSEIRVFIAESSPVFRNMLMNILSAERDIEVVGEAGTGQSAIIMLDETGPDVVLLDAAIGGGMSVGDVVAELKSLNADLKILICADKMSSAKIMPAAEIGAEDFVTKPYNKVALLRAIREAAGA